MQRRRWITVKAAAEHLSLHPVTIYRLIDKGEIKATKIGRSVRIDFFELEPKLEKRMNGPKC